MSSSSMYVIDQEFQGFISQEYGNSWLFSPIVWDVLLEKYMHDEIQTSYGYKKSMIGPYGNELQRQLNTIINNCECLSDRICWEISMQQIFFSKDKEVLSQGIKEFLETNQMYHLTDEGVPILSMEHIADRFNQMADDILAIDEQEYPCFVFKNTSVDDGVSYWFSEYDEEADDYRKKSLKEWDRFVGEFVVLYDRAIEFYTNIEFFNQNKTDSEFMKLVGELGGMQIKVGQEGIINPLELGEGNE